MPQIKDASISVGGTAISVTGGTATTLKSLGQNLDEHIVYVDDGLGAQLRPTVSFKVTRPKASATAPSGFTQARTQVVFKQPMVLATGELVVNTFRATIAVDVETSEAEIDQLVNTASQLLGDADFSDAYNAQSVD